MKKESPVSTKFKKIGYSILRNVEIRPVMVGTYEGYSIKPDKTWVIVDKEGRGMAKYHSHIIFGNLKKEKRHNILIYDAAITYEEFFNDFFKSGRIIQKRLF